MVMSEAMGTERSWRRCGYENRYVSPPIVGECYILKIGNEQRYVHAGVYPTHAGFDLHVQEVSVHDRVEHHEPMYTAIAASDIDARGIAEVLARDAFSAAWR